jgi:hypothetical protein
VITGFNTDIEHNGVVYHVQTEDKGLDSPLILSLVYSGGAILASKRSRYEDLIEAGFNEEVLTERVKRQHRLICAAINAGRIEDLKRMGVRSDEQATTVAADVSETPYEHGSSSADDDITTETFITEAERHADGSTVGISTSGAAMRGHAEDSAYTVYDARREAPPSEVIQPESGLALTILDDEEFRAGESFTIHALLEDRSRNKKKPVVGVPVSVRILGTAFRPQIYSVKTERDGIAIVSVTMPSFTSGRAAVLVRAVVKDETIEVRRVIYPAA